MRALPIDPIAIAEQRAAVDRKRRRKKGRCAAEREGYLPCAFFMSGTRASDHYAFSAVSERHLETSDLTEGRT